MIQILYKGKYTIIQNLDLINSTIKKLSSISPSLFISREDQKTLRNIAYNFDNTFSTHSIKKIKTKGGILLDY